MSKLPRGWVSAKLQEICEPEAPIIYGILQPGQNVTNGVPYVRPTEIQNNTIVFENLLRTSQDIANRYKRSTLALGDLLLSIVGTIGKVAVVPPELVGGNITQSSCRIRPNQQVIVGSYLKYFLQSPQAVLAFEKIRLGTAVPRLNLADVRLLECPICSLPEQRRIVAKLDSLFARTKVARDELARITLLIEHYRQAILEKAFTGKLTQQFRNADETDAYVDQPWAIPKSWSWKKVSDAGRVSLGRQRSPQNHQGPYMRPYVRAANITWSGWNLSDVKWMNFHNADFAKFKLMPGDVLINEGSGSSKEVGKPAIWEGQIEDCCFQNTLVRVQPTLCTPEYLYYYLLFSALTERFVSQTQGVNIYHIGKEGLAKFPIPIAPRPEQEEIVNRIQSGFGSLQLISTEHARAAHLLLLYAPALLDKAFRGELVPQNPNEEPAACLARANPYA